MKISIAKGEPRLTAILADIVSENHNLADVALGIKPPVPEGL